MPACGRGLLSQAFARQLFGNENPIGRRVAWTGEVLKFTPFSGNWRTVVGVVGNTRDDGLDKDFPLTMYMPFAQELSLGGGFVIRADSNVAGLVNSVTRIVRREAPTVLVIDPVFGGAVHLDWVERLARLAPSTQVVVLTSSPYRGLVSDAIGAGARGFLLKETSAAVLAEAIRTVNAGGTFVAPDISSRLVEGFPVHLSFSLTGREISQPLMGFRKLVLRLPPLTAADRNLMVKPLGHPRQQ